MNATDLFLSFTATDLQTTAIALWRAGNNAGDGFDPGSADFGEPLWSAESDDQVSVYRDGDDAVLIGQVNGEAWAVRVSP